MQPKRDATEASWWQTVPDRGRRVPGIFVTAGFPPSSKSRDDSPSRRLVRERRRSDPPHQRVPAAFLGGWAGGEIVGRASIRFALNDHLAAGGGHIGSRVVIERCGGEFESVVLDPREGVEKRRYWIR